MHGVELTPLSQAYIHTTVSSFLMIIFEYLKYTKNLSNTVWIEIIHSYRNTNEKVQLKVKLFFLRAPTTEYHLFIKKYI